MRNLFLGSFLLKSMRNQFIRKLAISSAAFGLVLGFPAAGLAAQTSLGFKPEDSLVRKLISEELLTSEDLGIENPGLLASNPFYFVKNFRRSTLRTFTFNQLKKADFELDVLNEKAAEIKLLQEINPESAALENALADYRFTLETLQAALDNIRDSGANPPLDRLLDKLTDRALKHLRFFDELKGRFDLTGKERVDSLQEKFGEVLTDTLERLDNEEKLTLRLEKAARLQSGGLFKEFRLTEIFGWIEEKAAPGSLVKAAVLSVQENLLLVFQIKLNNNPELNSVLPAVSELLPGNGSRRIKTLDQAREYFSESDFRNDLGQVRQLLLDLAVRSRNIGKQDAESEVSNAKELIGQLKILLDVSGLKSGSWNGLLSRAEFNLKQGEESLAAGQPVSAFGQASLASAAAKNAFSQLFQYRNLESIIRDLKTDYDGIINQSREAGLDDKETSREFFSLLDKLEKSLVVLADLAGKKFFSK